MTRSFRVGSYWNIKVLL